MTPEDKEIAIHFANIDKYMKEARNAVILATVFVVMIAVFFFWFITR